MKFRVCLAIASLVLVLPVWAAAAEESAPAAKPGPAAAEFARIHAEWKRLLSELSRLKIEYPAAQPQRKTEIESRWKEVMQSAVAMEGQFISAAEKAYAESPNTDKQVTELLIGLLSDCDQRDDYERAFALGKLLMDNKCPDKHVPGMAGIAAFCAGEFDLAETWLGLAVKDQRNWMGLLQDDKDQNRAGIRSTFPDSIQYYKTAWAKEKRIREAEAKASADPDKLLPRVLLKTSQGEIEVELLENEAPNTVANFVSLVERGFYNGLAFHRVLPGFMAQGGDPKGNGSGGPGYQIPCECSRPEHRLHFRGTLSMAHSGPDTGGSQFFLTFVPTRHLDGKHTVFGRVVKGFEVLAKIQRINPEKADGTKPDKILEAKVLAKRKHDYVPKHTDAGSN